VVIVIAYRSGRVDMRVIPDSALKKKFQKATLEAKVDKRLNRPLPKILATTQNRKLGTKSKTTIEREIYAEVLKEKLSPHLDEVVSCLIDAIHEGDTQAMKEYFERVFGKTPVKNDQGQAMDLIKGITIVNYGTMDPGRLSESKPKKLN
jgi:hypothetical protein